MESPINTRTIDIPDEIIDSWQSIVDTLADIIHVPAALIMRVDRPFIEVFRSSQSGDNPYEVGDREHLAGLYCERVITTKERLLVPNALKDLEWVNNPDVKLGMISYLGFPLVWPNGEVFGTICVLDAKENRYTEVYERLLLQLRELVEAHLRLLYRERELEAVLAERKQVEREIEERRLYLEGVLAAAPDAIVTLDAGHRIAEWNSGAERLFGYSREEVIGRNLDHLITNPDTFEEAVGLTQIVMSGREVPPLETVRYRKDGSPVDVIVAGSPILVGDELIGIVAVYTDITARVRAEEALRTLLLVDELTGLYNRRGFLTLGQQQLKTANRAKRRMVLLFADFDDLKWINDTLGHPAGDLALIDVARVLKETFRESDIIARVGGDEFVVLAIETDRASPEVLTARLQENLEARNAEGGRRYRLSLSVGIARYDPEAPCSIDELVARADRSMYEQRRRDQKS